MYKQTVITIVLTVALAVSALANVSYSRLQKTNSLTSKVKAASSVEPAKESHVQNSFLPKDAAGTYRYWFWLLPVMSLPFLILAIKKRGSDDLEKELWPYTQYSVGTKGGMSFRTSGFKTDGD